MCTMNKGVVNGNGVHETEPLRDDVNNPGHKQCPGMILNDETYP